MGVKDQSVTDGLERSKDGRRPAGAALWLPPACCRGSARFITAASASGCLSRNGCKLYCADMIKWIEGGLKMATACDG